MNRFLIDSSCKKDLKDGRFFSFFLRSLRYRFAMHSAFKIASFRKQVIVVLVGDIYGGFLQRYAMHLALLVYYTEHV